MVEVVTPVAQAGWTTWLRRWLQFNFFNINISKAVVLPILDCNFLIFCKIFLKIVVFAFFFLTYPVFSFEVSFIKLNVARRCFWYIPPLKFVESQKSHLWTLEAP